jgi:hypothetical protein
MSEPDALGRFLAKASGSSLLLPATAPVAEGAYDRVGVRVPDPVALRAAAVPDGVRSAHVAVAMASGEAALALVPRPDWPRCTAVRSRRTGDGGWLLVVRFERPVPVAALVAEVGRQSVWPDRTGNRGLFLAGDPEISESVHADEVPADLAGPLALGPLDERLLNPRGFLINASSPAVDLASLDLAGGVTPELVASLRPVSGVRADLSGADQATLRSVAALGMAGVPVTAPSAPAAELGATVAAALTAPVDLDDPLAREEHSVVLRRAALDTFSSFAWRRDVGRLAGVPVAVHPAVSIVLATRRPGQLEHALAQVARQRGVERLELVLAPHGFEVDVARVRELLGPAVAAQVVPASEDTLFGDVLAAAAAAAGGDVVMKMDDDDWYSPDAVADLLLARAYSGAELVGMPAELHYLVPKRMTVKRGHTSEHYARFVAGGTLMVDRELLREVGSFRSVRKYVDAQLLAAVRAAGAETYRTHGLGYLLRRDAEGHTWQVDMDYLLDPARVAATWEGFRPSRLLELDASDAP